MVFTSSTVFQPLSFHIFETNGCVVTPFCMSVQIQERAGYKIILKHIYVQKQITLLNVSVLNLNECSVQYGMIHQISKMEDHIWQSWWSKNKYQNKVKCEQCYIQGQDTIVHNLWACQLISSFKLIVSDEDVKENLLPCKIYKAIRLSKELSLQVFSN